MYVYLYGRVASISCTLACVQSTQLTGRSHSEYAHAPRTQIKAEHSQHPMGLLYQPLGNHCPDFLQNRQVLLVVFFFLKFM